VRTASLAHGGDSSRFRQWQTCLSGRTRHDLRVGLIVYKVRIHGRGGQGVVTAAELLSVAAFDEGRYAQAFPTFGSERTGAPVVSYCRISDTPIRIHEPITTPDALIIQDPTLLQQVRLFDGVGPSAFILINTSRRYDELGIDDLHAEQQPGRMVSVPATDLARRHLGRPLPNAALLGGFAALTGIVSLEAVLGAIRQRFRGAVAEGNVRSAEAAYGWVSQQQEASSDA
jgi:pyruvate ferredoxin oxidoreductase gamma subunit